MQIMITGAASAIATAAARLWAAERASFFLVDRDGDRLQTVADDLRVRGAVAVTVAVQDLTDETAHPALLAAAQAALSSIDVLLIAQGTLPDQVQIQDNWEAARRELAVNFLSAASLLTRATPIFVKQGHGTLAVISSVAGERGRQSNYIYGSAKGALTIFSQGLRNRLSGSGVHVLTIKPGFVDTPMTAGFKKGRLWVQPEVVGRGILRAVAAKKDMVYAPWFWRWIMLVIRSIPESRFKRMQL